MRLTFVLNGTNKNPFHEFGLIQNPFPQDAKYEHTAALIALNKLGGDPIPNTDYIRETLKGFFTDEFIESVVSHFKPGVMLRCTVTYGEKK